MTRPIPAPATPLAEPTPRAQNTNPENEPIPHASISPSAQGKRATPRATATPPNTPQSTTSPPSQPPRHPATVAHRNETPTPTLS